MKTTRHIVQYQDTADHWQDSDTCHTEAESLAILADRKCATQTLDYRVVRRTTETTETVIATSFATTAS